MSSFGAFAIMEQERMDLDVEDIRLRLPCLEAVSAVTGDFLFLTALYTVVTVEERTIAIRHSPQLPHSPVEHRE